uniref:Pseudin-4 n=1 Tax=Pseudis paradoxa TaxID=43558 RepID=PS4_PSEPD|nr:RecName: Full=Pseudin-4 [Pseudis paradoxa]
GINTLKKVIQGLHEVIKLVSNHA